MAEYCRLIFGDALLMEPLDKYPVSVLRPSRRGARLPMTGLGGLPYPAPCVCLLVCVTQLTVSPLEAGEEPLRGQTPV